MTHHTPVTSRVAEDRHAPANSPRSMSSDSLGGFYKRKEVIGDCTLYLGDCLDVLPLIAGEADMLCSDIAYELTSGGNAHQSMGGLFATNSYDNDGKLFEVVDLELLGGPFSRALKPDADIYIMLNDKNLARGQIAFEGAGFQLHNILVWDKIRATRNRWYMKNCEFTLYMWKGKSDPQGINDCGSKQLFQLNNKKVTGHPTEKPVELMSEYIRNSSNQGDLVLDPMMGAGATLVAAVQMGRRAVGIDISEQWFDVACERVRQAYDKRGIAA